MAKTIDVYLLDELVGHPIQDDRGHMVFDYVENRLNKPSATQLSQSLPLCKGHFTRNECRGTFAGILLEAKNRELIARNPGISARNYCAMLEKIGGARRCCNVVSSGEPLPKRNNFELTRGKPMRSLRSWSRRDKMASRSE